MSSGPAAAMDQPHVIPSQGDLLGDLLNLDLGPPVNVPQVSSMQMGAVDLLGGGLDSLVSSVAQGNVGLSSANYIIWGCTMCMDVALIFVYFIDMVDLI